MVLAIATGVALLSSVAEDHGIGSIPEIVKDLTVSRCSA